MQKNQFGINTSKAERIRLMHRYRRIQLNRMLVNLRAINPSATVIDAILMVKKKYGNI
jgi:uncharacterized protein (DUF362 family)